jgi:hypothetical protein
MMHPDDADKFHLALLTTPWLTLPYSRLDWVALGQPYEPTGTPTATPSTPTPPAGPHDPLVVELNHRLDTTNTVTFRIERPRNGDNNLCAWDSGYGSRGLYTLPVLSLLYRIAQPHEKG